MIGPTQVGYKDGRPMWSLHCLFMERNIKKPSKNGCTIPTATKITFMDLIVGLSP